MAIIDLEQFRPSADRMPALLARYQVDYGSLERLATAPYSPWHRARLREFLAAWEETVTTLDSEDLTSSDRADSYLFRNRLAAERRLLDREEQLFAEMEPLIPFAPSLIALEDDRRRLHDVEGAAAAATLDQVLTQLRQTRAALEVEGGVKPSVAVRAARCLDTLGRMLEGWFGFSQGYDPLFTWWVETPYAALAAALPEYAAYLRDRVAGASEPEAIVGDPLGYDALCAELEHELIPYTPAELIEIGQREMDWCLDELKQAAAEMGHGEDWRAALEQVKAEHVTPGDQPRLVRELAREAIEYVQRHDLVSVPPLAAETWRMEMMSPERQKLSPFFLGGESIVVSFPTNTMDHARKRMSLRGNNPAFARATVHHELIPGHHLQGFSEERYRPYRRLFWTPFWTEGWTLHWEMLLWERGFARTPAERIGMLFWRRHRGARVLFTLNFHLGRMSAAECVALLVDEVGHERDNALAEVRRSFAGDYPPLYQCAYLIGGLQVHALHRELVKAGEMSERQFHDAVLRENHMPIAVLRAVLSEQPIGPDFDWRWRFRDIGDRG